MNPCLPVPGGLALHRQECPHIGEKLHRGSHKPRLYGPSVQAHPPSTACNACVLRVVGEICSWSHSCLRGRQGFLWAWYLSFTLIGGATILKMHKSQLSLLSSSISSNTMHLQDHKTPALSWTLAHPLPVAGPKSPCLVLHTVTIRSFLRTHLCHSSPLGNFDPWEVQHTNPVHCLFQADLLEYLGS